MTDNILAHWKMLLLIWVGINFVFGMPSPKPESPAWYKWLFASLHGIAGGIPRIIITLFPQYSKLIPGGTNGTQNTLGGFGTGTSVK